MQRCFVFYFRAVFTKEVGGYAYVSDYYHADEIAMEAMAVKTDGVQIEQDRNVIWFIPEKPTTGLIFYPGGKVEYTAYAPLLQIMLQRITRTSMA